MRASDPTNEPRGFTRLPASKRGLLVKTDTTTSPFFRGATAKRCKALTPCVVTLADGTQYELRKSKSQPTLTKVTAPGTTVKTRHRRLRGPITDYIAVADRVGLNPNNVAMQYRYRRDNGYSLPTDVAIETNATFRGA